MRSSTLIRRAFVLVTAAVLALGTIALPATAKGGGGKGRGHNTQQSDTVEQEHGGKGRGRGRSQEAKARKAARFVVVGFVTAVDSGEVTIKVKGGHKRFRGTTVDVTVPAEARVNRNDEAATAADLQVGDHAMARGMVVGGVLTAHRVNAEGKDADDTTAGDTLTQTEPVTGDTSSGSDTSGDDESDGADDSTSGSADTTTETAAP